MKRIVMSNDPERKEMDTTQIYLSKNSWGQFLQLHTNADWVILFLTKKPKNKEQPVHTKYFFL